MKKRDSSPPEYIKTRQAPATTPEDRENQLISRAVDLAEQQFLNGTASAQVIVHYLKLGSSREKLEQSRLEAENKLLEAKRLVMESEKRTEVLISEALSAMRSYMGVDDGNEESDADDF